MASLSRGFAGLASHGFANGFKAQHVAGSLSSTSTGSSHMLTVLRLRLSCSQTQSASATTRFFSSSRPISAKGPPPRSKVMKNQPSQYVPRYTQAPKTETQNAATPKAKATPATRTTPTPASEAASTSPAKFIPTTVPPSAISGVAEQLGRRTESTLLYQAPSQFWYRFISIFGGACTILYTFNTYWSVIANPPEDLLWWIPHAFSLICGCMLAGGGYLMLSSFRIIRVIKAIPSAHIQAISGKPSADMAARAVKDAGLSAAPPVFLEIEIGRVLPILPARKRYILPHKLEVPFRFVTYGLSGEGVPPGAAASSVIGAAGAAAAAAAAAASHMTSAERVKAHAAEQERLEKELEYERAHLMTAPFRHAVKGARTGLEQISRVFTREGFVKVLVNGERHKIDAMDGWALENGRALDRLVTLRNDIK